MSDVEPSWIDLFRWFIWKWLGHSKC